VRVNVETGGHGVTGVRVVPIVGGGGGAEQAALAKTQIMTDRRADRSDFIEQVYAPVAVLLQVI